MQTNHIVGYTLLVIGILLIVAPLWQTFQIFTGNALPPQVFMKPIQNSGVTGNSADFQSQVRNAVAQVLPVDLLNNTLNLANWFILMWILMFGGGKLADIGVKLIK